MTNDEKNLTIKEISLERKMNSEFSNQYITHVLPPESNIVNAEGDRLYTNQSKVLYNFFNENLRWLCGYNNYDITRQIEDEISLVRENSLQLNNLFNQIKEVFCRNAGRKYKNLYLTKENTYDFIYSYLKNDDKEFFLTTSRLMESSDSAQFVNIYDLLEQEKNSKGKLTEEGWSIQALKNLFKKLSPKLLALVINPALFEQSTFISNNTCKLLVQYARKYKIPVIWDESYTGFYRTGTFYFLNQYSIDPDFIFINSPVTNDKNLHLFLPLRKMDKKLFREYKIQDLESFVSEIIVLHSNLIFIIQMGLPKMIERVSYRLNRKLNALSANLKYKFYVRSKGLLFFIGFNKEQVFNKCMDFLYKSNILTYNSGYNSLFLMPQLNISFQAIDIFIQTLDNFFRNENYIN